MSITYYIDINLVSEKKFSTTLALIEVIDNLIQNMESDNIIITFHVLNEIINYFNL